MKTTKTKSKSTDQQLMLEGLKHICDAVSLTSARIDMLVERVDELTKSRAPEPAPVDRRPRLNWVEWGTVTIHWSIKVDPATLILIPGTTLRYDQARNQLTTFDGVSIGRLAQEDWDSVSQAAGPGNCNKLHVYLTTARKLGIKLGRPA